MGDAQGTLGLWVSLAVVLAVPAGYAVWSGMQEPLGMAPEFSLVSTGYEGGRLGEPVAFNLSDHAGQVVVLDLMAVACVPCEKVAADVLRPLWTEFGQEPDFTILSIDTWADEEAVPFGAGFETGDNVIQLQKQRGLQWRHALDTDDVWLKYNAVALPKLVVIDSDGTIVAEHSGTPRLADVRADVVAALAGDATPAFGWRLPLLGLAALAGASAFFAPCSVGLVPAYMGLLLGGRKGTMPIMWAGLVTAAGVVSLYAVLALALLLAGPLLTRHLGAIAWVTGGMLVLLGVAMLWPGPWQRLAVLGQHVDARGGYFAFGAAFALASFGCTGPVFLPIMLGAFARGTGTGFAAMGLYGGVLALLLVLAAGLVATGHQTRLRRFLDKGRALHRLSGALFVVAGLYVLWYQSRTF